MRKIILPLLLLLPGCSSMPSVPSVPSLPGIRPYKMDIQQGNYVTQEMVAKLKPGMTRAQVRFILGTPLVVDLFRTDRWDYVYVYQKGGAVTEQRKLTVIFADDKLARVEGDVVPAGSGEAGKTGNAAAESPRPAANAGSAKPEPGAAPAKPGSGAAAPKPEPGAVPSAQGGSNLTTGSGEPVKTETPKADAAKPESPVEQPKEEKSKDEKPKDVKPPEEKSKEEQPQEEKGFFGRMLDKIGL